MGGVPDAFQRTWALCVACSNKRYLQFGDKLCHSREGGCLQREPSELRHAARAPENSPFPVPQIAVCCRVMQEWVQELCRRGQHR